MKKLLNTLEADIKEISIVALSAFLGALAIAPGNPLKDALVAAVITGIRTGVARAALLLGSLEPPSEPSSAPQNPATPPPAQ